MNKKLDTIIKVTGIALASVFGTALLCVYLMAIDPLLLKLADLAILVGFIVLSIICLAKHIKGSVYILTYWCITLAANIALRFFIFTGGLLSREAYITFIKYALPSLETVGAVLVGLWFVWLLRKGGNTDDRDNT